MLKACLPPQMTGFFRCRLENKEAKAAAFDAGVNGKTVALHRLKIEFSLDYSDRLRTSSQFSVK